MILVRAIVRPEKKDIVLSELSAAGFHAATVVDVVGRGKQKGIRIGDILYDEIPKALLMLAVPAADKQAVVDLVIKHAKSENGGAFGDGKIFISPIEQVVTVSSGATGL